MLSRFQSEIMGILASNRSKQSYIAGGAALNRNLPRLSEDIDIFHQSITMIDNAVQMDVDLLERSGYRMTRVRELMSLREWMVRDPDGQTTKLQWTRDTSYMFYPPVADKDFGFTLSFEDLAVNKIGAAADRGRLRDYHDIAILDRAGCPPWMLALACMGKDSEHSPLSILDLCIRQLAHAGDDDEDPEYDGHDLHWPKVKSYVESRLREDREVLREIKSSAWAGCLPVDRDTGRMPLGIKPEQLKDCLKHRASPFGSWPTNPQIAEDMLRLATHPNLEPHAMDLQPLGLEPTT